MKSNSLTPFFNPTSIAIVGASDRVNAVGTKVFSNLSKNGFTGELTPVNPKHQKIHGKPCFASLKKITQPIDLVIITTPAKTVPDILIGCGEKNIRAVVILSAGFSETGKQGAQLEKTVLEIAKRYSIRLIGPNCLGIIRPSIGLNATFDNSHTTPGHLALVSQSGALCAAILDWADQKKLGFSSVISLGNSVDVGFGEILDYLALDNKTKSILLYIEGIHEARHFMSGLRAAARIKPVFVIKAGRHSQGMRAAMSHTGALVGADDVFDAALRRAGAVRLTRIEQLFSAAEIFSSNYHLTGNRLGIITNGGGAGVMAADAAADFNLLLPEPSADTFSQLNEVLPAHWSHHNPIDILGDATPKRYQEVISTCLKDDNFDGVLAMLVPVAMSQPLEVAKEIIGIHAQKIKPLIACWMGEKQVKTSKEEFARHHLPCFSTPEAAVEAFSFLADYQQNQQLLLQVPEPLSNLEEPDIDGAKLIIEAALAEKRNILTGSESKAILKAFGIPVTEAIEARTAEEAVSAAKSLGFPVVMKINSPEITHKQEVGGVQLNITQADVIPPLFSELIARAKAKRPKANILGVTIERMYKTPNDRELMIGVIRDVVFGPVISFGAGGVFVEVLQDRAIALPPLNKFIAESLIARTRAAKLLGVFREMPAANLEAIMTVLLRVSQLVCELPHIQELDINPLIANDHEVIAVDARMSVSLPLATSVPYGHMAIHPYPHYLVKQWELDDGIKITLRPIRPEDASLIQHFVRSLSPGAKHFRFMENFRELSPEMLLRLTQIDYDREIVLVATHAQYNKEEVVAIADYFTHPDLETGEFGLIVGDAWQKKGIGFQLMTHLFDIAKMKKIKSIEGGILSGNAKMIEMAQRLGFSIKPHEGAVIATKKIS